MICRLWYGYTTPGNADAYERLLREEIIRGIAARGIAGYRGMHLMRRDKSTESEFVTAMWFDSMDDVRAFAGDDPEAAVVPPAARALLSRYDARSTHLTVLLGPDETLPR